MPTSGRAAPSQALGRRAIAALAGLVVLVAGCGGPSARRPATPTSAGSSIQSPAVSSSASGSAALGRAGGGTTTAPGRPSKAAPCRGTPPPARFAHVVWIVMENRGLSEILAPGAAPFLASLASACGLATHYAGVAHPSLPNYVALTSGSTGGIGDDGGPGSHPLAGPNLFSLLGRGWRALEEAMPGPCDRYSSGRYAVKHNPAAYYTDLARSCPSQDVPLGATPDLSARFTLITPDLCDDMHDCSTRAGDTWLARIVPEILNSSEYRAGATVLFITWDEDDSGGRLVPTYVAAPAVAPGTRSVVPFDHYSLLRTTEELLGVAPLLGAAGRAPDMRAAFDL